MKKVSGLIGLVIFYLFTAFAFAGWDSSPTEILNQLKDSDVQKTALDNAVSVSEKGVTSTLTAIKQSSTVYLQWLAYFGLGIALILIIYNGIMLIISGITGSNQMGKFKKRFISLTVGVVILTSGYLIIKFVVSVLGDLFG